MQHLSNAGGWCQPSLGFDLNPTFLSDQISTSFQYWKVDVNPAWALTKIFFWNLTTMQHPTSVKGWCKPIVISSQNLTSNQCWNVGFNPPLGFDVNLECLSVLESNTLLTSHWRPVPAGTYCFFFFFFYTSNVLCNNIIPFKTFSLLHKINISLKQKRLTSKEG